MVGENQSLEVRGSAAKALGKLGEHAASAAPALANFLVHGNTVYGYVHVNTDVRRGGW